MSRKIILILAFIILAGTTWGVDYCRVVPLADGVRITLITPFIGTEVVENRYGKFVRLSSPRAQTVSPAGAPWMPSFILPVGIPPRDTVKIDTFFVYWGESKKLDYPLAPVDSFWWEKGNLRSMPVPPRRELYRRKSIAVDYITKGFLRSQRFGEVIITPVEYDPGTRAVRIADSVVVILKFRDPTGGTFVDEGEFERVLRALLVNYEQAKNFRLAQRKEVPANPFAPAEVWYRVPLREGGVFAITANWIQDAGLNPAEVSPDSVRVFIYGIGTLPLDASQPLPTLEEVPLVYVGNGGQFDDSDTLFVYAPGPEWWSLEGNLGEWHDSPYCDSISYWVAIGGSFDHPPRRAPLTDISSPQMETDYGWTFIHIGEALQFDEYEDNGWYWQIVYGEAGVYFSDPRITTEISPNGGITVRPSTRLGDITCNGVDYSYIGSPRWVNNLQPGSNSVVAHYSAGPNNDSTVYFKYVEVNYAIHLQPQRGVLHFFTRDIPDTVNAKFILSGFDEVPIALDVTDIFDIKQRAVHDDGGMYFVGEGGDREYYVFTRSAVGRFPAPVVERDFPLWSFAENHPGINYLVLSPEVFNTASFEEYLRGKGLSPVTVSLEEIMREFGFGRYDPTAIRNFLCYVYNTYPDPKPVYAAFVGDGHYDFLHKLTDEPIYFPPAMAAARQTDAFYATFSGGSEFLEMLSGRIPVRSQEELERFVDKVSHYSECAPFGEWRITVVPVGDDEYRTDGPPDNLTYTINASELVESVFPARTIADPIYEIEYPRTPSGKKPLAHAALMDKFNRGAVLINYIGHGNYHLWAHEHILNMPGDLSSINNDDKLPLVMAFSCYVSQFFYLHGKECIAELLVRKYPGGAIATVSATGGSFAGSNQALNRRLVEYLFGDDPIPVAGALVAARAGLYTDPNNHDSQYILMGDPSQILAFPYTDISVSLQPETLFAGQWDTVRGTTEYPFDGVAKIFLFAPDQTKFYESPLSGVGSCNYTVPGKVLFAGAASVRDGQFELPIFVPKNLSETMGYKIVVYAYGEENCDNASGARANLVAQVESGITVEDSVGPQIAVHFDKPDFRPDGVVCSDDGSVKVVVELSDEHGINMGALPGQGVVIQLDDVAHRVDISRNLEYALDDPTRATATYTFENIPYGGHTLCVQAWDNVGNASQYCVDFELVDCTAEVYDVLPYPNPFHDGVDITFWLSGEDATADATLEIFTIDGRKIYSTSKTTSASFDWLHWDGTAPNGKPVARGIYIYVLKVKLHSADGKTTEKTIRGKISKE